MGNSCFSRLTHTYPLQALTAMYPEDEGCFMLGPAEQEALAAAAAAVAAGPAQHNLSGTVPYVCMLNRLQT